jgi:hypothetical protein
MVVFMPISLMKNRFISGIVNALNAEIALGTVTNADEGF